MCRWQHLSFVSWPATSAGSAATGSARTRWSMPRFSAAGASAGSGHAPTSTGRFGHGLRLPLMLAGATGRCDRVSEGDVYGLRLTAAPEVHGAIHQARDL